RSEPASCPFLFPFSLFATDVVVVYGAARQCAACTAQDGAQRLGAARRDHIAQHTASKGADDSAGRAVVTLAIIATVAVAVDRVVVTGLAAGPGAVTSVAAAMGAIIAAGPVITVTAAIAVRGASAQRQHGDQGDGKNRGAHICSSLCALFKPLGTRKVAL